MEKLEYHYITDQRGSVRQVINGSTEEMEITGYSTKDVDWRNPVTFLGELCGDMTMDYKEYIPTAFSLWFKNYPLANT